MTAATILAKAVKAWVEDRRTGFLVLNFRNGELKYIEHQQREHVDPHAATGPTCPSCGEAMAPREGGLWACPACGVKRTEHQLRAERR